MMTLCDIINHYHPPKPGKGPKNPTYLGVINTVPVPNRMQQNY